VQEHPIPETMTIEGLTYTRSSISAMWRNGYKPRDAKFLRSREDRLAIAVIQQIMYFHGIGQEGVFWARDTWQHPSLLMRVNTQQVVRELLNSSVPEVVGLAHGIAARAAANLETHFLEDVSFYVPPADALERARELTFHYYGIWMQQEMPRG